MIRRVFMPELTLDWNKYIETAVRTAAEGIVMLENKNDALPLKNGTHVALFGRMQTHYYKSGTGSGGMVNVSHVTDIREGLADSTSVTLDKELIDIYDKWDAENPITADLGWGMEAWSQPEMPLTQELCKELASRNDAAVIVIARTAGEDRDNTADKGYNISSDIQYSATVGAALEAASRGIHTIAFSEHHEAPHDVTDKYIRQITTELLTRPLAKNEIWNVNFPGCTPEECKGILYDRVMSQDDFYAGTYNIVAQNGDRISYMTDFGRNWAGSEGTDLKAIEENYVSVGKVSNYH